VPDASEIIFTPAFSSTANAFGPTLPVMTASTPASATMAAAFIPAPWAAFMAVLLSSTETTSPVPESTITKKGARPNLGSTSASRVFPVELTANFIFSLLVSVRNYFRLRLFSVRPETPYSLRQCRGFCFFKKIKQFRR
jgi:hypothetical protein